MTEPVPEAPRRGLKRKTKLILLGVLLAPIALFVLYTWSALAWDFSDGERAGILQKFSEKGWICKTYEGELAMTSVPGVMPVLWAFSVRDDEVAQQLRDAIGKHIAVHYTEHKGIPTTCFGETSYFVDSVTVR
ncbi:MAG TPA: hypothetical protein PLI70_00080 [Gemmatimonadales bacterium]|nr:hypothetical protein [Gemmatimonadales bacterium]HRZ09103.1 hypothetical protein [Gemmatimonadales bacterium]